MLDVESGDGIDGDLVEWVRPAEVEPKARVVPLPVALFEAAFILDDLGRQNRGADEFRRFISSSEGEQFLAHGVFAITVIRPLPSEMTPHPSSLL